MIEDPLHYSRFFWIEFKEELLAPLKDQTLVEIGYKHSRLTLEHFSDVSSSQLRERIEATVCGQFTAQRIENRRMPLLMTSQISLLLGTEGQSTDGQRDQQHDGKGKKILNVTHRECHIRRNEEKIEHGDAQNCCEDRRPPSITNRHEDDSHQIHHDESGDIEIWKHQPCNGSRERDAHNAKPVGQPVTAPFHRLTHQRAAFTSLTSDHINVSFPAFVHELCHHRPEHCLLPYGTDRLSHDDLRHVSRTSIGQQFL